MFIIDEYRYTVNRNKNKIFKIVGKVEAKRDIIIINLNLNLNLFKERSDLNMEGRSTSHGGVAAL